MTGNQRLLPIEWSVAGRPLGGYDVSGDIEVVIPSPAGAVIAVADGLGHGSEAALAAGVAASALTESAGATLTDMVLKCHEQLRPTRGVALSLAAFDMDAETVTWLGIGNVDGILVRADSTAQPPRFGLPLRGGVVGYRLPPFKVQTLPVCVGDWLILATDGIKSSFHEERPFGRSPGNLAEDILRDHGRTTDDALVLAARYRGRTQ